MMGGGLGSWSEGVLQLGEAKVGGGGSVVGEIPGLMGEGIVSFWWGDVFWIGWIG